MKKSLTNNEETISTDNTPMNDNVLEDIIGGSWDDGTSYGTDICNTCGATFSGSKHTVKSKEKEHTKETGHTSFSAYD